MVSKKEIEQAYDGLKEAHIREWELDQRIERSKLDKQSAHKQTQLARQKVEELRN